MMPNAIADLAARYHDAIDHGNAPGLSDDESEAWFDLADVALLALAEIPARTTADLARKQGVVMVENNGGNSVQGDVLLRSIAADVDRMAVATPS